MVFAAKLKYAGKRGAHDKQLAIYVLQNSRKNAAAIAITHAVYVTGFEKTRLPRNIINIYKCNWI